MTKVQDVSFDFENKLFGLIPRIQLEDKKDYEDSGTKEFDRMAFKYLGDHSSLISYFKFYF